MGRGTGKQTTRDSFSRAGASPHSENVRALALTNLADETARTKSLRRVAHVSNLPRRLGTLETCPTDGPMSLCKCSP